MIIKFIQLCLLFILVGGGFIIYNQPAIRNQILGYANNYIPGLPDVKGISTSKTPEIPKQLKSGVDDTINQAQKKARDIKVGDLMDIANTAQKTIKDFRAFQEYIKEQVD